MIIGEGMNKKKMILLIVFAIALFIGFPLLGILLIPAHWGMIYMMLLLLIMNPAFFVFCGGVASENIKKYWFLPLTYVLVFSVSIALILGMREVFYMKMYLVISYMSMGIKGTWKYFKRSKLLNLS